MAERTRAWKDTAGKLHNSRQEAVDADMEIELNSFLKDRFTAPQSDEEWEAVVKVLMQHYEITARKPKEQKAADGP